MINDANVLKDLISMGMNERNSKVYLALLRKQDASLPDLNKLSGVRLNKLYEVINNLIREGYCTEKKIGRKRFFNAIDPRTSIDSDLRKMKERLEKGYNLKSVLKEIYNNTDEIKEPVEYIEIFHGNANIHRKFCSLAEDSRIEVLSFTKPPWAISCPIEQQEQGDALKAFINRNGISKTIYELISKEENDLIPVLERDRKVGEQSKISDKLPIKLHIFDRKALLITDAAPLSLTNELRMVLIKQQTIVDAFIALFDFFWQQSMEVNTWEVQQKK